MHEYGRRRFESPIEPPASRLLAAAPVLARAAGRHGRRRVDCSLALVPMVDFLLGVVLFLLSFFTASGEPCLERRVRVPGASEVMDMVEAPMVTLVGTQILVDGVPAGSFGDATRTQSAERLDELFSVLENKRELWRQINPERSFPGALVIRAERNVPAVVVKNVIATAAYAGYPRPAFMVRRLPRSG